MIIDREESENRFLLGYRKQYTHMVATSHKGPLVLIDGDTSPGDLDLAAQITARFSQGRNADKVDIEVHTRDGKSQSLQVQPMAGEAIPGDWYL